MSEAFEVRVIDDHKISRLNRDCVFIQTDDPVNSDGANHKYRISVFPLNRSANAEPVQVTHIHFQDGGLQDVGVNGLTDQALLAIVLDRMRGFNDGPYRCRENSIIITKLEEAMLWMGKRASERANRNVEGRRVA